MHVYQIGGAAEHFTRSLIELDDSSVLVVYLYENWCTMPTSP
jgi:hypothetical protein